MGGIKGLGTIRVAIHLEELCKQARDHCALLVHNQWPPGFRFFPTDEELVVHYLCKKTARGKCSLLRILCGWQERKIEKSA